MKFRVILNLVAVLTVVSLPKASAQWQPQNWQAGQQNQINQDANSGLINPNQAANLDRREAQIQAQQQMYRAQNGGYLTPQEQNQVGSELRGVNGNLRRDMAGNGAMNYANGAYNAPAQWQNGNGYPQQQWRNMGGYPQAGVQNVNGYPASNGYMPQNGYQQGQNPQQFGGHHHQRGMASQFGGWPGGNGGQQAPY